LAISAIIAIIAIKIVVMIAHFFLFLIPLPTFLTLLFMPVGGTLGFFIIFFHF